MMPTLVTGTNTVPFSDPDHSRTEYYYQNNADFFLESAVTAAGLYSISAVLDGNIQIKGTVRTVLT